MNEYIKNGLMVAAGGLVMWGLTGFLDRSDAGATAQTEAIAEAVIDEKLKTPSGKPLTQVVDENTKQLIILNTQLPHIVEALEQLSSD